MTWKPPEERLLAGMLGTGLLITGVSIIWGLLVRTPDLPVLRESIRILFYHVPMWFAMTFLFAESFVRSIIFLVRDSSQDFSTALSTGVLLHALYVVAIWTGVLGLLTGMVWASVTWGTPWHGDPKQNAALFTLLLLSGGLLLNSMLNPSVRVRVFAGYTILAFLVGMWLIFVYPRTVESLHPGAGGNPAFNIYDLEGTLRPVLYLAVIGWILTARTFAGILAYLHRKKWHVDSCRNC